MGAFFAPREWGRLLTAMVSPFNANGDLDLNQAEIVAEHLITVQKNDGLVINGTTGESPTLTEDEKFELLRVVLNAVGDRASVVMGTGTYNTSESIKYTQKAEKLGAHGVMAVNPYYNRPSQEGMIAHFTAIAESTSLPVMLYNIAPRSAVNLETPTVIRLAETVPNIVAVKEASGNLNQVADVCAAMPEGFRVYSGDDPLTLPMMSLGAYGLVSVSAHLIGAELKSKIEYFPSHPGKAAATANRILPMIRKVFMTPSPAPVKYGLSRRGICGDTVRLPIIPLTDAQKAEFDTVFSQFN